MTYIQIIIYINIKARTWLVKSMNEIPPSVPLRRGHINIQILWKIINRQFAFIRATWNFSYKLLAYWNLLKWILFLNCQVLWKYLQIYKFKKILRQTARLYKRQIRKWRNRFWDEIHCHGLNHKDKELKKDSKYNVAGIRLETVIVFGNRVTVRIPSLRNVSKVIE